MEKAKRTATACEHVEEMEHSFSISHGNRDGSWTFWNEWWRRWNQNMGIKNGPNRPTLNDDLTSEQRQQMKEIMIKWEKAFHPVPGKTNLVEHSIQLSQQYQSGDPCTESYQHFRTQYAWSSSRCSSKELLNHKPVLGHTHLCLSRSQRLYQ